MSMTFSKSIPEYCGGKLNNSLYNAGGMLADDRNGTTPEDCPMQLITETNESEFASYIENLKNAGFTLKFYNSTPSHIAAQLSSDDTTVYTYYTRALGEVRIIEDRAGVTVDDFSYSCETEKPLDIVQYGLYYDKNNDCTATTVNCGMMYIVRLADNSLFIIDGGHRYQCSDEAVAGMAKYMHQLTETSSDEKIRIAGWYFTHAHGDHIAACVRLLRTYPGIFDIERVMFNFPSFAVKPQGYDHDTFILKDTLREFCPNVKCLKLHTGQKFTLANAEFDVLYTHEDAVNYDDTTIFPFRDFNCTSSILKMTNAGKTVMWLGDTNVETEQLVSKTIPQEMWKSDVVQVAHHCFNYLSTLYPFIDAKYAFMPNSYFGSHTPENTPKLADVIAHLSSSENIWYEEYTTAIRPSKNGFEVTHKENCIGVEHDGVDLYGVKA